MIQQQHIQWLITAIKQCHMDWHCIKITSIILIILTLLSFVLYIYGIFTKVHLKQTHLPKMTLLFKQKSGKYQGDYQLFKQIQKQTQQYFKISKYIAIFYDDPIDDDPAKCRSIIGVAVNCGQQWKIQQFVKKYPQYEVVNTRESKGYGFKFPLISSLSFWIASFKVYRKIRKIKLKRHDLKLSNFTIQIYDNVQNCWNKTIQVIALNENFRDFQLWKGVQGENIQYERKEQGMREEREQNEGRQGENVEYKQVQEQNQSQKSENMKAKVI